MPEISIRVSPFVSGKPTDGSKNAQPYEHLLGAKVGHRFVRVSVGERALEQLVAAGVFDIRDAATNVDLAPSPRRAVLLIKRDAVEVPKRGSRREA